VSERRSFRPGELDRDAFVIRFGGVYERSPWVAERVWDTGEVPDNLMALSDAMAKIVEAADQELQLALLRSHPDLAGRLAVSEELTTDSRSEQASAGLDRCTPEEFAAFQQLNSDYKARFGFPFIIAVRGLDRKAILAAFRRRLNNVWDTEFREALDQVNRIARLRLAAIAEQS
jgi:OHCU decarboxylase